MSSCHLIKQPSAKYIYICVYVFIGNFICRDSVLNLDIRIEEYCEMVKGYHIFSF